MSETVIPWGLESRGVTLHVDDKAGMAHPGTIVIDVETDEKDNFVGIALTSDGNHVYYYTALGNYAWYALEHNNLIGHNIKSDAQWLRKWGVKIRPEQLVYDTMLASYVQDSSKQSHSLKDLSHEILGIVRPTYKDIVGRGKQKITLDKHPVSLVANYCGSDVFDTFKLLQYFTKILTDDQKHYLEEVELPTMRVIMEMEERGVQVNAAYLKDLDYKFNVEIQQLVEDVRWLSPSIKNINSDKQVGDFLVSKGFTLPKTAKGKNSVAVKALEPFNGVPFVKTLKRHSELEKLVSTYTKSLLEDNYADTDTFRLHANFNQAVTETGRLSSSGPNLQNIPTRTETGDLIRAAFIAKLDHTLLDADYSQIEPRLFAHFSQDPELLKIFREGHDLYDYIAAAIGCDRPVAKTVWLALSYNAGPFKISQTAHIAYYTAQNFIDRMKKKFKVAFDWKERVIRQATNDKYITTLLGARRRVSDGGLGPNYMVQGSAGEINKLALVACQEYGPIINVHDELLFEISMIDDFPYEIVDAIKTRMESVVTLTVPLVVEVGVGCTWQAAKG